MNEIIKIVCPRCGAVLSVRNQPGIETKNVTCPVCKYKGLFTTFKRQTAAGNDNPPTDYTGKQSASKEETDVNIGLNFTLGRIIVPDKELAFQLKPGKNVIGRKSSSSTADFQIPCINNRMSREHLVIEIRKVPGKGFVHYVSLYKEKVNPTFLGSVKLEYSDTLVLNHGDVIKLPDVDLLFEIPDDEATV